MIIRRIAFRFMLVFIEPRKPLGFLQMGSLDIRDSEIAAKAS